MSSSHPEDLYFEGKLKARVRAAAQGLGQHTPEELRQSSKLQARMRLEVFVAGGRGSSQFLRGAVVLRADQIPQHLTTIA